MERRSLGRKPKPFVSISITIFSFAASLRKGVGIRRLIICILAFCPWVSLTCIDLCATRSVNSCCHRRRSDPNGTPGENEPTEPRRWTDNDRNVSVFTIRFVRGGTENSFKVDFYLLLSAECTSTSHRPIRLTRRKVEKGRRTREMDARNGTGDGGSRRRRDFSARALSAFERAN